jgi:DNA repair exonuclease SbcCD nuclease subunit
MDFTFVHCADVHLDTPLLARKDDLRRRLRDSTYRAFRRLADLALDHQARFVLIAGDLFDTDVLSYATQLRIGRDFERLCAKGVRVFIAPGNHDPVTAASFYRKARLPDGVHVFQSLQPEAVAIEEKGC